MGRASLIVVSTATLRDGTEVDIRAIEPGDKALLAEAFSRLSPESRYRRFFTSKRSLSEGEIKFFLEVNFTTHVALVCELEEGGRKVIAGGGRYVVCAPGSAEVAFMVDDAHQSLGIGSLLMRHLVACARSAGPKAPERTRYSPNCSSMRFEVA